MHVCVCVCVGHEMKDLHARNFALDSAIIADGWEIDGGGDMEGGIPASPCFIPPPFIPSVPIPSVAPEADEMTTVDDRGARLVDLQRRSEHQKSAPPLLCSPPPLRKTE